MNAPASTIACHVSPRHPDSLTHPRIQRVRSRGSRSISGQKEGRLNDNNQTSIYDRHREQQGDLDRRGPNNDDLEEWS
jgi:hypothetical protein